MTNLIHWFKLNSLVNLVVRVSCCCSDDIEGSDGKNMQRKQNRFVPLSESVTACATHPLNGTTIAGTKVCLY